MEYEGEYLNNEKWNGKTYDLNGKIIYEIKNGNGRKKEYDEYGRIMFEGEYLNGRKNGKGKEYNIHGYLIFEGEYLNGKRDGKGKIYNGYTDDYDSYIEAEYINGEKVTHKNCLII